MLSSKTRSQLEKHNWVELEKRASNRSQKLARIKNQSITGIQDLGIIAKRTPDTTQDEIFTSSKLEPLIKNILKLESSLSRPLSVKRLDARRSQLCAMLINKCSKFLKLQYDFIEHDSPGLAAIILEQLDRASKISNEIANKTELLTLRNVASKSKLEYLFNWKKVSEKDEKLLSYINDETGIFLDIETIKRNPNGRSLEFELVSEYGEIIYSVLIKLTSENDKAILLIDGGSSKIERELVVRKENDELYVFKKTSND